MSTGDGPRTSTVIDRVTISYPDDEWIRNELETDTYTGYLQRAKDGPIEVGDEWDEFVSRGCGTPRDVILRVEAVEGGSVIGPETEFVFTPREEHV